MQKIKVDLYDYLPLQKKMTFCDAITLINLVFNKNENNYRYYIFLEKDSYELPKH